MTECSSCGSCCDPITLAFTQDDARRMLPTEIDARTRRWIIDELVPISRREGMARSPWITHTALPMKGGQYDPGYSQFYECRNFDRVTRRCTAYEDRPPVCSGFPHYGKKVLPTNIVIPHWCSFRADIGQPVEPEPDWQAIELTRKDHLPK